MGTATVTPLKPPSEYKGGNRTKDDDSVESVTKHVTRSGCLPNKTSKNPEHRNSEQKASDLKGRIEAAKGTSQ